MVVKADLAYKKSHKNLHRTDVQEKKVASEEEGVKNSFSFLKCSLSDCHDHSLDTIFFEWQMWHKYVDQEFCLLLFQAFSKSVSNS